MDDLIRRQDAIDCVSSARPMVIRSRIASLPKVDADPQWIPCRKRLPKAGKNVLISMDDYNVTVGRIVKIGKTKMWQIDLGEYPIDTFTAWMPLPKPYEVKP